MVAKNDSPRATLLRETSSDTKAAQLTSARLSHEEEMAVLRRQAAMINSSPESAKAFLIRAGLMTESGRLRRFIRD